MQNQGCKKIKRAAAAILSAALMITSLPQNVYAAQTGEAASGSFAAQEEPGQEAQNAQLPESQTEAPQTEGSQAESAEIAETNPPQPESQIPSDESSETETEPSAEQSESKPSETETSELETTTELSTETAVELSEEETETAETVIDNAAAAQEIVPAPDVDSEVYPFREKMTIPVNAFSPIAYASVQDPVQISENTYRIENKDQFFGFLTGKSDYDGCTVILACDLDLKSESASFNGSFAGTFDGDGRSIHHLKVEQGLFPIVVSGAEIKNLHISDAAMTGTKSAGIVAARNDGRISNCVVTGTLESTSAMDYLAGVVGVNEGTVENCVFAGQITAAANTADAEKDLGGIVGRNEGKGKIESCYAVGGINTKAAAVAGIAATNSSRDDESIKNCANYMSIDGAYTIAGIVAINEGTVADCANYAPVRQRNHYQAVGEAGGIAGQNKVTGIISRCYNYASIAGEDKNIGGIAAATSGQISECGNYGAVSGLANIGGIVGLYNGLREHSISSCFNQGNITGNGTTAKAGGIGGILGSADKDYKAPIENCYNAGSVRGSRDTRYIGGIAGILKKGYMRNCYTAGSVSGYGEGAYAAMLAGFMGKEEDASYAGCLFISGSSKYACYRESGGVLEAEMEKTANELKTQDALAVLGGSFSDDSGNINNGYPILNGQTAPVYMYPVVYELNGGYAQNLYYNIVENGGAANKPDDPTKKYAEFQGWYSDAGLNAPFSYSAQITAPITLYAKWKADVVVEDMELAQTEIELIKDEEYTIKVRFTPENAQNTEISWESDDTAVASVDEKGRIRAGAPGTARIRGSLKDNSLSKVLEFKVTVTDKARIIHIRRVEDGVELKKLDIAVKEIVTLEAVVSGFSDQANIWWSSGKEEYVKVTPRTNALGTPKADVEGLKPTPSGDPVRVSFSVVDGDVTATGSIEVTVLPLATDVKVKLGEEDVTDKTVTYDLVTKRFIAVGTNKLKTPVESFGASVSPGNASQKVTWSSGNSSVIKFDDKDSGVVTGNISGTAEITAMAKDGSNKAGKTTVRAKRIVQALVLEPKEVNKATPVVLDSQGRVLLTGGCSVKLVPKFTPADVTDERLSWKITSKSSNGEPITIDAEKRIVTAADDVKTETKVTLTATSLDEGGASFDMEFVIIPKVTEIEIYNTADMAHPVNGKTIGINPETDSMALTLQVKNKPENASQVAVWKSSNTKTATVEDHGDGSCTVTAKGYGSAVITATAADGSGVKATVTINVSSLVSSITIKGSSKVAKGGTIRLSAEVLPKSAANKAVVWETDMPSIVTVDKATGQVTGKQEGPALIRATAADGSGVKAELTLMVTKAVEKFDLMVPDGNDNIEDDVIVTDKVTGIDLDAGMEAYTLAPRILPKEACQTVEWKSSNEKIVEVDEHGTITAKALGKAVVTAFATDGSGKQAKTTVNVATLVRSVTVTGSHYVGAGQSIQLKATVTDKDAANKSVNWTSSDKNAVIVNESGLATAAGRNGYAVITAEAADGSGKRAEHIVYVMGKSDEIKITEFSDGLIETKDNKKTAAIDIKDRQPMTVSFMAALSGGSERQEYEKEVEWKTSDKTIADIASVRSAYGGSEASVTLKKAGTVTITARTTDGSGRADTCTLKVENTDPIVTITGPKQVANGKKIQLSAGGAAVWWESSDTSLATVASNGKVTAKKNVTGNVTIKATSKIGSEKSDTYEIFVGPAVTKVDIAVNGKAVTNEKLGIDLIREYDGTPLKLYANVDGAAYDDKVTWKSNKTAVAAVSEDGSVEIKKPGTAVVTATATDGSGKKAKVTLVVAKQVTKIAPADGNTDVYIGYKKSVQLNLSYKPLAATTKKVTWTVEDGKKDIVSVSKNGKVTAKKYMEPGSYATVTASAADSGAAYCEFHIYVTAPAEKVQVLELIGTEEQEYAPTVGIDLDTREAKATLKASLTSANAGAAQYGICQKVTWKSGNTAIAEVKANDDGSCTVTGLANGKATLTATAADGSKKAGKITVYVGKLIKGLSAADEIKEDGVTLYVKSVKDKKTLQLSEKININPITATNKTLTYKSSDPKIVSVNAKGKLTAKKRGDATITVSAADGSRAVLTVPVRVLQ